MRRWLGRAECISFLRKERARFRTFICAQNEAVLAQIPDDREGNQMARVHAIKTLERTEPSRKASGGLYRWFYFSEVHNQANDVC
jgi:hypothetical protein